MSTIRFKALENATTRTVVKVEELEKKSVIFGSNVFNEKAMKQVFNFRCYIKLLKVLFNMEQKLTEN